MIISKSFLDAQLLPLGRIIDTLAQLDLYIPTSMPINNLRNAVMLRFSELALAVENPQPDVAIQIVRAITEHGMLSRDEILKVAVDASEVVDGPTA